jgi:hypothetical protein
VDFPSSLTFNLFFHHSGTLLKMLPVYQAFSSQLLETQAGGMPHYSNATHNILF